MPPNLALISTSVQSFSNVFPGDCHVAALWATPRNDSGGRNWLHRMVAKTTIYSFMQTSLAPQMTVRRLQKTGLLAQHVP